MSLPSTYHNPYLSTEIYPGLLPSMRETFEHEFEGYTSFGLLGRWLEEGKRKRELNDLYSGLIDKDDYESMGIRDKKWRPGMTRGDALTLQMTQEERDFSNTIIQSAHLNATGLGKVGLLSSSISAASMDPLFYTPIGIQMRNIRGIQQHALKSMIKAGDGVVDSQLLKQLDSWVFKESVFGGMKAGVAGWALQEPAVIIGRDQLDLPYTMEETAFNLAMSVGMGAGLGLMNVYAPTLGRAWGIGSYGLSAAHLIGSLGNPWAAASAATAGATKAVFFGGIPRGFGGRKNRQQKSYWEQFKQETGSSESYDSHLSKSDPSYSKDNPLVKAEKRRMLAEGDIAARDNDPVMEFSQRVFEEEFLSMSKDDQIKMVKDELYTMFMDPSTSRVERLKKIFKVTKSLALNDSSIKSRREKFLSDNGYFPNIPGVISQAYREAEALLDAGETGDSIILGQEGASKEPTPGSVLVSEASSRNSTDLLPEVTGYNKDVADFLFNNRGKPYAFFGISKDGDTSVIKSSGDSTEPHIVTSIPDNVRSITLSSKTRAYFNSLGYTDREFLDLLVDAWFGRAKLGKDIPWTDDSVNYGIREIIAHHNFQIPSDYLNHFRTKVTRQLPSDGYIADPITRLITLGKVPVIGINLSKSQFITGNDNLLDDLVSGKATHFVDNSSRLPSVRRIRSNYLSGLSKGDYIILSDGKGRNELFLIKGNHRMDHSVKQFDFTGNRELDHQIKVFSPLESVSDKARRSARLSRAEKLYKQKKIQHDELLALGSKRRIQISEGKYDTWEMNFQTSKSMHPKKGMKGKTTLGWIKARQRTATSRKNGPWVDKVKVGDIVKFENSLKRDTVKPVYAIVTKAPYPVSSISKKEWSNLEGWGPGEYHKYADFDYYQFQYEMITPEGKDSSLLSSAERALLDKLSQDIKNTPESISNPAQDLQTYARDLVGAQQEYSRIPARIASLDFGGNKVIDIISNEELFMTRAEIEQVLNDELAHLNTNLHIDENGFITSGLPEGEVKRDSKALLYKQAAAYLSHIFDDEGKASALKSPVFLDSKIVKERQSVKKKFLKDDSLIAQISEAINRLDDYLESDAILERMDHADLSPDDPMVAKLFNSNLSTDPDVAMDQIMDDSFTGGKILNLEVLLDDVNELLNQQAAREDIDSIYKYATESKLSSVDHLFDLLRKIQDDVKLGRGFDDEYLPGETDEQYEIRKAQHDYHTAQLVKDILVAMGSEHRLTDSDYIESTSSEEVSAIKEGKSLNYSTNPDGSVNIHYQWNDDNVNMWSRYLGISPKRFKSHYPHRGVLQALELEHVPFSEVGKGELSDESALQSKLSLNPDPDIDEISRNMTAMQKADSVVLLNPSSAELKAAKALGFREGEDMLIIDTTEKSHKDYENIKIKGDDPIMLDGDDKLSKFLENPSFERPFIGGDSSLLDVPSKFYRGKGAGVIFDPRLQTGLTDVALPDKKLSAFGDAIYLTRDRSVASYYGDPVGYNVDEGNKLIIDSDEKFIDLMKPFWENHPEYSKYPFEAFYSGFNGRDLKRILSIDKSMSEFYSSDSGSTILSDINNWILNVREPFFNELSKYTKNILLFDSVEISNVSIGANRLLWERFGDPQLIVFDEKMVTERKKLRPEAESLARAIIGKMHNHVAITSGPERALIGNFETAKVEENKPTYPEKKQEVDHQAKEMINQEASRNHEEELNALELIASDEVDPNIGAKIDAEIVAALANVEGGGDGGGDGISPFGGSIPEELPGIEHPYANIGSKQAIPYLVTDNKILADYLSNTPINFREQRNTVTVSDNEGNVLGSKEIIAFSLDANVYPYFETQLTRLAEELEAIHFFHTTQPSDPLFDRLAIHYAGVLSPHQAKSISSIDIAEVIPSIMGIRDPERRERAFKDLENQMIRNDSKVNTEIRKVLTRMKGFVEFGKLVDDNGGNFSKAFHQHLEMVESYKNSYQQQMLGDLYGRLEESGYYDEFANADEDKLFRIFMAVHDMESAYYSDPESFPQTGYVYRDENFDIQISNREVEIGKHIFAAMIKRLNHHNSIANDIPYKQGRVVHRSIDRSLLINGGKTRLKRELRRLENFFVLDKWKKKLQFSIDKSALTSIQDGRNMFIRFMMNNPIGMRQRGVILDYNKTFGIDDGSRIDNRNPIGPGYWNIRTDHWFFQKYIRPQSGPVQSRILSIDSGTGILAVKKYLGDLYDGIVSKEATTHQSGDFAGVFSSELSSKLFFNSSYDSALFFQEYSTHDLNEAISKEISNTARFTAFSRFYGVDSRTLSHIENGKAFYEPIEQFVSEDDFKELSLMSPFLGMYKLLGGKPENFAREMLGANSISVNDTVSTVHDGLTTMLLSSSLGMAGVSSASDIGTIEFTLKSFFGEHYNRNLWDSLRDGVKNDPNLRKETIRSGITIELMISNLLRATGADSVTNKTIRKVNDIISTLSGLNYLMNVGRVSMSSIFMSSAGDAATFDFNALDPDFRKNLENWNISPLEWDVIRSNVHDVSWLEGQIDQPIITKINNLNHPSLIALANSLGHTSIDIGVLRKINDNLEAKWNALLKMEMDKGVLMPGYYESTLFTLGTQKGTIPRLILSNLALFKQYPTAFLRKHFGPAAADMFSGNPQSKIRVLWFLGYMLALGYALTIIKDILSNREPRLFGKSAMLAALQNSGMGGLYTTILADEWDVHGRDNPVNKFIDFVGGVPLQKASKFARAFSSSDTDQFSARLTDAAGSMMPGNNWFASRMAVDAFIYQPAMNLLDPDFLESRDKFFEGLGSGILIENF